MRLITKKEVKDKIIKARREGGVMGRDKIELKDEGKMNRMIQAKIKPKAEAITERIKFSFKSRRLII